MRRALIAVVSLTLTLVGAWMLYNKFVLGGGSFRFYTITALFLFCGGGAWFWFDVLGPKLGLAEDDLGDEN
ncbi:MAG: hypothetical protein AAFY24_26330 [Pseudomonadota bacterium]